MHIFQDIRNHLLTLLHQWMEEGFIPPNAPLHLVTTEPPKDPEMAEIATNAAMVLAKHARLAPSLLADRLIQDLLKIPGGMVLRAVKAGPGFVNMHFAPELWNSIIPYILTHPTTYGNSNIGEGKSVNVEYVSTNPTGPMHIGHARGAVFGDTVALLLEKAGWNVTKEYYINDAGKQIETLGRSSFLRYKQALGHPLDTIPEGLYPGEYLIPVGEKLASLYQNSLLHKDEAEWLPLVGNFATNAMMDLIKKDLHDLGVTHSVFTSEQSLRNAGKIEEAKNLLEAQGLLYKGALAPPKGGKTNETAPTTIPREHLLFRSTDFGDDNDRAIQRDDGSYTYFAADAAYVLDKLQRGFTHMVLGLGIDHVGYKKRIEALVKALGKGDAKIVILFHNMVKFVCNGEAMKMSKRSGNFTTVRDVLDHVDKDIIRFMMLTRSNEAPLEFDIDKVQEQSKDNPVFYVHYAYARICSVLRHAETLHLSLPERDFVSLSLDSLGSKEENLLLRHLAEWPRIVEQAAQHYEPHRIAYYLQNIASDFHSLWNSGKDTTDLRFIVPHDPQKTVARLALIRACAIVIESGLRLFNVTPMKEMR